jgi:vacuolar iron transporter family protein
LLTAIAGAIAGAVSMCAGEFVATKSQNEVMKGELALERKHVEEFLELELAQLDPLLELIGIEGDDRLLEEVKAYYRGKPLALLKIMTALEFGVLDTEERSPFRAGITSCGLFVAGSVPSVLPFAFSGENPQAGLFAAAALTIVSLMVVGAIKTWATRTKCVSASVENLIIAGFGGGFAYGVGVLFEKLVNG